MGYDFDVVPPATHIVPFQATALPSEKRLLLASMPVHIMPSADAAMVYLVLVARAPTATHIEPFQFTQLHVDKKDVKFCEASTMVDGGNAFGLDTFIRD